VGELISQIHSNKLTGHEFASTQGGVWLITTDNNMGKGDLVVYLSNGEADHVSSFCDWRWLERLAMIHSYHI